MNKNLTELVFILDKSGSMSGLEDDTIGGLPRCCLTTAMNCCTTGWT
jgi:hypothetical protein